MSDRERAARRILAFACVIAIAGVALAGTIDRTLGGVVVVVGWIGIVYGLHVFGRAGGAASDRDEAR